MSDAEDLQKLLAEDPEYAYGHGFLSSLLPAKWKPQDGSVPGQGELGDFIRATLKGEEHWALPTVLRNAGNALTGLMSTPYGKDIPPEAKNLLMALPAGGVPAAMAARAEGNTLLGTFTGYHGSGEAFDEFADHAIGSGEGAQVYGHGHYVAGRPGTAKKYYEDRARENQSTSPMLMLGDEPLTTQHISSKNIEYVQNKLSAGYTPDEISQNLRYVAKDNADFPDFAQIALRDADFLKANQDKIHLRKPSGLTYPSPNLSQQRVLSDIEGMLKYRQPGEAMTPQSLLQKQIQAARDDLAAYKPADADRLGIFAGNKGQDSDLRERLQVLESLDPTKLAYNPPAHFYEVKVLPKEEDFLHWDKSLGEQSPQVKEKLQSVIAPHIGPISEDETWAEAIKRNNKGAPLDASSSGEDIYNTLHSDPRESSRLLKEAGIPGIRYYDQVSRGFDKKALEDQLAHYKSVVAEADKLPESEVAAHRNTEFMRQKIPQLEKQLATGPSHNYVVFDPKHIQILRRNGEPLSLTPYEGDPFKKEPK